MFDVYRRFLDLAAQLDFGTAVKPTGLLGGPKPGDYGVRTRWPVGNNWYNDHRENANAM